MDARNSHSCILNDASSDRSLLRRLQAGQEDAATQLYLRYARRLQALACKRCASDLACRVDPEDIVQSVFFSFFHGVSQGFYDIPTGQEAWGLLLVITLNKIRAMGNFHHAARRDVRRTPSVQSDLDKMPGKRSNEASLSALRLVIQELLGELPEDHRQIVLLRIEEHQIDEIADRTHYSRRTVERVLQDFRRRLTAALEEDRTEEGDPR
jgi:RNA polymerase sigma-70 factor (ECF subfamily)